MSIFESATTSRPATPSRSRRESARSRQVFSEDSLLTVGDWAALPDTKPRYELLEGRLVQKPMTKYKHAKATSQLLFRCMLWAEESGWQFLAEGVGVKLNERNGVVPDIIGYAPGRVLDPETFLETSPPDFVVEVLSRRTAKADRTTKREGYARAGVPLYVIVDPTKKTLEVFRLAESAYGAPETLRDSDVWAPSELPGLRVELARLWM